FDRVERLDCAVLIAAAKRCFRVVLLDTLHLRLLPRSSPIVASRGIASARIGGDSGRDASAGSKWDAWRLGRTTFELSLRRSSSVHGNVTNMHDLRGMPRVRGEKGSMRLS